MCGKFDVKWELPKLQQNNYYYVVRGNKILEGLSSVQLQVLILVRPDKGTTFAILLFSCANRNMKELNIYQTQKELQDIVGPLIKII